MIGIIGATGSGKTTLVQMIPRLYDATRGQVLVDGVDVRDYSLKNLREGVGMVLQKNVLFSGTIEENLRWEGGRLWMKSGKWHRSRRTFVTSFTNGYDTDMGQGGVNVSNWPEAETLYCRGSKRPKILILDDSTSAVDTATEARIRQCFSTSLKDTTKIGS
ncbi:MAG: ATP-binding cassette domain-containing protein [Enterocloster clostridioformis]